MYGIFKLHHVTPYEDMHALKHEPNNSLHKKTDKGNDDKCKSLNINNYWFG